MPTLTTECDQPKRLLDINAATDAIPEDAQSVRHAFVLGICGRTGCGHALSELALHGENAPTVFTVPDLEEAVTPHQLHEVQDAITALALDPAYRDKIVVLPPGQGTHPVVTLVEVHRDGTLTSSGNTTPVIEDGWLVGFDLAQLGEAAAAECAHELVLMPVVELALTYRCRKCPADWRVPLSNDNAGKSIETISHEAAAEAGGSYVGPFVYKGTEPHPGTYSNY